MLGVTTYLYTIVHIIEGRLELHRSQESTDRGATAVEYGLMVGLIAAVIITIVATLGTQIAAFFTTITTELA